MSFGFMFRCLCGAAGSVVTCVYCWYMSVGRGMCMQGMYILNVCACVYTCVFVCLHVCVHAHVRVCCVCVFKVPLGEHYMEIAVYLLNDIQHNTGFP